MQNLRLFSIVLATGILLPSGIPHIAETALVVSEAQAKRSGKRKASRRGSKRRRRSSGMKRKFRNAKKRIRQSVRKRRSSQKRSSGLSNRIKKTRRKAAKQARSALKKNLKNIRDMKRRGADRIRNVRKSAGKRFKRTKMSLSRKLRNAKARSAGVTGGIKKRLATITRGGSDRVRLLARKLYKANGQRALKMMQRVKARFKGSGGQVMETAGRYWDELKAVVHDPSKRKKLAAAAVVAAGVAYYAHSQRDHVEHKLYKAAMTRIKVPVNGRYTPIETVVSQAIIERAPYLRNTTLANDPSAVMAYGLVAVAKKDFVEHVAIFPDGYGSTTTLSALSKSKTSTGNAIAALQASTAWEGMAMHAAEIGHFGHHGAKFAASYQLMEKTLGK